MNKLSTFFTVFCFLNLYVVSAAIENKTISYYTTDCAETFTNPIIVHNADIGIFPGDSNTGRKFIPKTKFISLNIDVIVTGIKAASDGTKLLVVATNGAIIFLPNNSSSLSSNRILYSSNMTIPQGDAFELTYNGSINKWVITDTSPE